jgi:putative hydrolase of HD superfamily
MEAKEYIRILDSVEALKNNTRHSWTSSGRHESVAEHSWRLTLMAFFLRDTFPEDDMDKVLKMCLVHDIGEAFTGDIPSFHKTAEDEKKEAERLAQWVDTLPQPYCTELKALYAEMDALQTREAKIYKALDNMEAVLQHNEADLSTWIPLERELQLTYGEDKAAFDPWLRALRAQLNADSRAKLAQEEKKD